MSDKCIFCEIVNKKVPSHLITEDNDFLAFLSIFPNTIGVTVVIPKKHYSSYAFDLDDKILTDLIIFSKKVAKILDDYFDDVGRTALVFEGFGVDHVHAKLFPMHNTSSYSSGWKQIKSNVDKFFNSYEGYISSHDYNEMAKEELADLAKKIRDSIQMEKNKL